MGGILALTLLKIEDICIPKYHFLREARREWDLRGWDIGPGDGDGDMRREQSEILRMSKWGWILYRADQMEREKKERLEEVDCNCAGAV